MRYSYTKALEQLTNYAYDEGYEDISFNHHDISYIDWEQNSLNTPKIIRIEGKYGVEIKTYLLLHELGHHELRKDWEKYSKEFPAVAKAEEKWLKNKKNNKYKRRTSYKVLSLEEEYKAWDAGLKLAQKLGIKVNPERWEAFKIKCLIGYIRWYGERI